MSSLSLGRLAGGLCAVALAALLVAPADRAAAQGSGTETVKFDTFDGVELVGTFYPGGKGQKSPSAIIIHAVGENRVKVVDGQRHVPVGTAELVGVDSVIVRQLELGQLLPGHTHEDVGRLVSYRHLSSLLQAERLIEGDRAGGVRDPVAGVDQGHRRTLSRAQRSTASAVGPGQSISGM